MADRDYYNERERSRGYEESRGGYGRDRDRQAESNWGDRNRDMDDRGPISRGADEVRSWFGDDEARRRRELDEFRERQMDPSRGRYPERGRSSESDRSWSGGGERGWSGGGEHNWRGGESRREGSWSPSASGSPSYTPRSMSSEGSSYYGGSSSGSGSPYASGSRGDFGGPGSRSDFGGPSSGYGSAYRGEQWGGSMGRPSGVGQSGRFGSFAGRGPRNYQRSDERIREEVNERLTDDPRIDASDIDVEVRSGEVILHGRVDERRDKRTAEEIVENLPGVKDVRNEIRVEQHPAAQEGSIGHTGNPQHRDDMSTLNLSGGSTQQPSASAGGREKTEKSEKK
jgi:hypothetical protein